jgi:hypothetical protein
MLYDPKWDLMTLENLIAWLEVQPTDGTYDWRCPEGCLIAHYLTDRLGALPEYSTHLYQSMPHYHAIAAHEPWTFGAALERANSFHLAK